MKSIFFTILSIISFNLFSFSTGLTGFLSSFEYVGVGDNGKEDKYIVDSFGYGPDFKFSIGKNTYNAGLYAQVPFYLGFEDALGRDPINYLVGPQPSLYYDPWGFEYFGFKLRGGIGRDLYPYPDLKLYGSVNLFSDFFYLKDHITQEYFNFLTIGLGPHISGEYYLSRFISLGFNSGLSMNIKPWDLPKGELKWSYSFYLGFNLSFHF